MSFKSHGAGGGVNTMKLGVNSMVCNRLVHRSKAVTSPLSVLVVAVCKALAWYEIRTPNQSMRVHIKSMFSGWVGSPDAMNINIDGRCPFELTAMMTRLEEAGNFHAEPKCNCALRSRDRPKCYSRRDARTRICLRGSLTGCDTVLDGFRCDSRLGHRSEFVPQGGGRLWIPHLWRRFRIRRHEVRGLPRLNKSSSRPAA